GHGQLCFGPVQPERRYQPRITAGMKQGMYSTDFNRVLLIRVGAIEPEREYLVSAQVGTIGQWAACIPWSELIQARGYKGTSRARIVHGFKPFFAPLRFSKPDKVAEPLTSLLNQPALARSIVVIVLEAIRVLDNQIIDLCRFVGAVLIEQPA